MKKWMKGFLSLIFSGILLFSAAPSFAASGLSNDGETGSIAQGTGTAILEQADYFGDLPADTKITVDIVLKERQQAALRQFINDSVDPHSNDYHRFLSVNEFQSRYGAAPGTIRAVTQYLSRYGIHSSVYPNHLVITATGTAGDFNRAFNITIQKAKYKGKTFHGTKHNPEAPKSISRQILAILGLTDYSKFSSRIVKRPAAIDSQSSGGPLSQDPADLIDRYNAKPLYEKGDRGQGQTIGIVTLADFNPEDAYAFWKSEGIDSAANRIHVNPVDGGSNWDGYEETTLDVEQSGAIAPKAAIDVYVGPNTDTGFVDAFASAINENRAAQLSVSWGISETYISASVEEKVESPEYAEVFNQLFAEAAAQGISMFAAAGDAAAYDASRDVGTYQLSVDNPADSPFITAAGGTTLPWGTTTANGITISNKKERAWGWDYLYPYFDSLGLNNPDGWAADYFVGGGGGFSALFPTPDYQKGVSGVNTFTAVKEWEAGGDLHSVQRRTQPETITGSGSGRNLPDLSLAADPYTGYKVYLSDPGNPGTNEQWATYGGTSFVSPQLNGLTALMNSGGRSRIGFWNPQIYRFAKEKDSPFQPLNTTGTANDNLYYTGTKSAVYNQATGLGTIDIAALADHFKNQK